VASAKAIMAKVGKANRLQHNSSISDEIDSATPPTAIRLVCQAAEKGDPLARRVMGDAARYLGISAAGMINLLDPELLILTGLVAYESRGMLLDLIREVVDEHVLTDGLRSVRVEQGTLGDNAVIIGAAASVCEEAFRVPIASDFDL
jgi:predicted NBD/HSP70 family sugar kinase